MAYHLSQEARTGVTEFRLPHDFDNTLFAFQVAAVKIAAHHLNKRGGVLIGDVVGLGKTRMATAVARIFEDDHDLEALIICPKNLIPMWEDYRTRYRLRGRVLSLSRVTTELPKLRRYRLVLIDESHNLRNREGKRYRAIQEYISENDSKVILLSATPYNKTYLDLSNQLRLFLAEEVDVGIRPEILLRELGETEFIRRYQCPGRSLAAFEKSEQADDWRELMRLSMVRRTRSFIQDNYATPDPTTGRQYLTFPDSTRSYFPSRQPKTVPFTIDDHEPHDQYALLYSTPIVNTINALTLPRSGLGHYLEERPHEPPTATEARVIADLSRAGKRLMGFCRTNLFKRLESSGQAFMQSVERHILRNFVYLHALGSCTPTLRRMFRDLSRPVRVVPIRRFSALDPCFPPASQPPRRSLRARPRLHSLRSNRDRCFTGPRRWPREPPNQSHLWARPHGLGPSRRPRRCAQPPPLGRPGARGRQRGSARRAQTGRGPPAVVGALAPPQVLAPPVCALTRRGAAPPQRRHALPQAPMAPRPTGGGAPPAAGGPAVLSRRVRAASAAGRPRHAPLAPPGCDHWRRPRCRLQPGGGAEPLAGRRGRGPQCPAGGRHAVRDARQPAGSNRGAGGAKTGAPCWPTRGARARGAGRRRAPPHRARRGPGPPRPGGACQALHGRGGPPGTGADRPAPGGPGVAWALMAGPRVQTGG